MVKNPGMVKKPREAARVAKGTSKCQNPGRILSGFWQDPAPILAGFWQNPGSILQGFWKNSAMILVDSCQNSGRILAIMGLQK